jgi:pimeloyl-ACP methyl ester carboxylesterase
MNVVLLHALPLDERMWEPQREVLAGHEVLAPRLYELGSSVDGWAEALLGRLDGRFVAVGASMGGYGALAMARQAPERVAGLVLAGSPIGADPPERRPVRAQWLELIAEGGAASLWEAAETAIFAGIEGETLEQVRSMALAQSPEGLADAVAAIRDRPDSRDVVASLPCPLLVAVGSADPVFPAELAREAAGLAPDGRLELFEGAGHLPNLEQPDRFNSVLRDFLRPLA